MDASDLTLPIYTDDEAARLHFEKLRWADGVPECPHCGVVGDAVPMTSKPGAKKQLRAGLYYCRACEGQFTATMGTVFEDSHIPMRKWLLAIQLMCASKKGVSATQLHRMLGFGSYRTAWFMAHRIREMMRVNKHMEPMGGEGQIVEADETYYGKPEDRTTESKRGKPYKGKGAGPANKRPVVALVERGGNVRTFHIGVADRDTVAQIVRENVDRRSRLHTDESRLYTRVGEEFAAHETVKHSAGEYARGDVHTNSAEGFFGVFKKGMTGVYQHCGEQHLARYLDEFVFRHNTRTKLGFTDKERATLATKGAVGKRLTLRPPQNV